MKPLSNFLEPKKGKDIQYEFQDLCLQLEELFGKKNKSRIWSLPYQVWFTESKGRDALKIVKQSKVCTLNYYIGIVKKLK